MQGKHVKVDGTTVEIQTGSAATAREIAAAAEHEVLRREGGPAGVLQALIEDVGDGLAGIARKLGRGTFELIANTALLVGVVIAFISWSRLLPLKDDLNLLVGLIGVAIIVGAKVSAGRWALALNEGKAAAASSWKRWALLGVAIDALAAAAFSAAVIEDEKTGLVDTNVQISELEREARMIELRAEGLDRPNLTAEILEMDRDVLLNAPARNREGANTGRTVGDWIGWGTDRYCIAERTNAYYVDTYCEAVIEAHRALLKRESYEAELAKAAEARAAADALRAARPEKSSAAALGGWVATADPSQGDRQYLRLLVPVALMLVIMIVMVATAFIAKRDPEIEAPKS